MKTLTLIYPALKKARTFESISTIEETVQQSVTEIRQRVATGLVKYESFLDALLSSTIPARGHAYRPSALELNLIAELEREEGH